MMHYFVLEIWIFLIRIERKIWSQRWRI